MKCKNCTYYDSDDKFCYYYLTPDTELIGMKHCKHWQKIVK